MLLIGILKDTRSFNFILYALCKNYFLAGKMVSFKMEYLTNMVYLGSDFFNSLQKVTSVVLTIELWTIGFNNCLKGLIMCRYKKMEDCVTPSKSSGPWKPFQERINVVPFRIISGFVPGVSVKAFEEDNRLWKKHVNAYKRINKIISSGRYRNIMDMNAGLGSFAAALESPKLWVMNVVPTIAEKANLGVIFERGLIGIYHDW